jgi:hypothetical protein
MHNRRRMASRQRKWKRKYGNVFECSVRLANIPPSRCVVTEERDVVWKVGPWPFPCWYVPQWKDLVIKSSNVSKRSYFYLRWVINGFEKNNMNKSIHLKKLHAFENHIINIHTQATSNEIKNILDVIGLIATFKCLLIKPPSDGVE